MEGQSSSLRAATTKATWLSPPRRVPGCLCSYTVQNLGLPASTPPAMDRRTPALRWPGIGTGVSTALGVRCPAAAGFAEAPQPAFPSPALGAAATAPCSASPLRCGVRACQCSGTTPPPRLPAFGGVCPAVRGYFVNFSAYGWQIS